MIVSRSSFPTILERLSAHSELALDTETTGLRPWNGDRLFSLIIGVDEMVHSKSAMIVDGYYFNFQPYPGLDPDLVLTPENLNALEGLFRDEGKTWYLHNAKYDMAILAQEGLELAGKVYCTKVQARVEHNDYMAYSLDACLKRIGLEKDDAVETYIKENKLWTEVSITGRLAVKKNLHYDRVPFEVISPYGIRDAVGTFTLGRSQRASLQRQSAEFPDGVSNLLDLSELESKLTKTVFDMERTGVRIDRDYCMRAASYECDRIEKAGLAFKRETGWPYKSSPKLLAEVFAGDKDRWEYTEKGNPSFTSDILVNFQHPAAKNILEMRDAESKYRFYTGFLYHADRDDVVHPNFDPGGTDTGRFSSSEPNFQNLTSEEGDEAKEFLVRRAIIPRPGFLFIMPDYDQVEYKLMLDYSKHMMIKSFKRKGMLWDEGFFEVANKVAAGFDIHQATADLVGVTRKQAKTLNFGLLYGMGVAKLAKALGVDLDEGRRIKARYFAALPYVEFMVSQVQQAIRERGWIRNWAGRKYTFTDRERAFTGPNKLIQGGAADVLKHAMVKIDEKQREVRFKSRMVLTIHDELPCEVHESEVDTYPRMVRDLMEAAYPAYHVPLTVGMEWSDKSLADKKKGFPV